MLNKDTSFKIFVAEVLAKIFVTADSAKISSMASNCNFVEYKEKWCNARNNRQVIEDLFDEAVTEIKSQIFSPAERGEQISSATPLEGVKDRFEFYVELILPKDPLINLTLNSNLLPQESVSERFNKIVLCSFNTEDNVPLGVYKNLIFQAPMGKEFATTVNVYRRNVTSQICLYSKVVLIRVPSILSVAGRFIALKTFSLLSGIPISPNYPKVSDKHLSLECRFDGLMINLKINSEDFCINEEVSAFMASE